MNYLSYAVFKNGAIHLFHCIIIQNVCQLNTILINFAHEIVKLID
jgi:hypothetical protein